MAMYIQPDELIEPVSLYSVACLYTRPELPVASSGALSQPRQGFSLWLAKTARELPPLLVLGNDSRVNEASRDACFAPLSQEEFVETLRDLPSHIVAEIRKIAIEWRCPLGKDERLESVNPGLYPFFVKPMPRLKSVDYLKKKDWKALVDSLVAFETDQKDERLKLVQRAHLLKGLDPQLNPHAIEATNGGTSKSTFYEQFGQDIDKVTPSSFLGHAKSPKEIFPGTVDRTEDPIGIDQIESQSAPEIMRYLFSLLDSGRAVISSGAVKFSVESRSIFAFLANATGYSVDSTKSFSALLDHLTQNAAIGRRFGVLLYGNDFSIITKAPSEQTKQVWKGAKDEFRAVEDCAWDKLQEIVHRDEVCQWLNRPIVGYTEQIETLSQDLFDERVRSFLREFCAGGQRRTRAAALYASLADNLAAIALGQYDIEKMLEDAEDYMEQFVQLNYASVVNISKQWGQESSVKLHGFFDSLPDLLKEVVSAVELRKRAYPKETTFTLDLVPYVPKSESFKGSFHEVIRHLNRRKDVSGKLAKIRQNFHFDIVRVGHSKEWKVTLLDLKPIKEIKPLGAFFDIFGRIDNSSPSSDTHRPAKDGSVTKERASPNDVELSNMSNANGAKTEPDVQMKTNDDIQELRLKLAKQDIEMRKLQRQDQTVVIFVVKVMERLGHGETAKLWREAELKNPTKVVLRQDPVSEGHSKLDIRL